MVASSSPRSRPGPCEWPAANLDPGGCGRKEHGAFEQIGLALTNRIGPRP